MVHRLKCKRTKSLHILQLSLMSSASSGSFALMRSTFSTGSSRTKTTEDTDNYDRHGEFEAQERLPLLTAQAIADRVCAMWQEVSRS